MSAISPTSTTAAGERFAERIGVRVHPVDAPPCGAWGTLDPPAGAGAVATGAVLALVEAVARRAAATATADAEPAVDLQVTGAAVQFRSTAAGRLTATATVPCEGIVSDRAGADGSFRFSVAVDVVDRDDARVASASVQWRAAPVTPSLDAAMS
jgi:hypothetical protein